MQKLNHAAFAALLITALGGLTAAAQTPPAAPAASAPADEPAVLADKPAGPAWWRVSKGDSEVWIIAGPEAMPVGTNFDEGALKAHLAGAAYLIVPAPPQGQGLVALKAQTARTGAVNYPPLSKRLPPDLYKRFNTALNHAIGNIAQGQGLQVIGDPRLELDTEPTIAAAAFIADGIYPPDRLGNVPASAAKTIITTTKASTKVVTMPEGENSVHSLLNVANLPEDIGQACLTQVIVQSEQGKAGANSQRDEITAWTQGDVLHAIKRYNPLYACPYGQVGVAFWAKATGDYVATVVDALSKPGKSVAVAEFDPLLMSGGILDQLTAKGYTVEWPY